MGKTFSSTYSNVTISDPTYNPVYVATTGVITGTATALYSDLNALTVTNAGQITGGTVASDGDAGVWLNNDGLVSNLSSGTIAGAYALFLSHSGTVINAGSVSGTGPSLSKGIQIGYGGTVTNQASAAISGYDGVNFRGNGAGTVINAGDITGIGEGVGFNDGGFVSNLSTGTISADTTAVDIDNSGVATIFGTVINDGLITGTSGSGVFLIQGYLTNNAGGLIKGSGDGIGFQSASSTLVNAGGISATSGKGVNLYNGGYVTNQAGGSIYGTSIGVYDNQPATVLNAGTIQSGTSGNAIFLRGGGTISNAATGTIKGGYYAVVLDNGSLTNAGTLNGAGRYGVYISGSTSHLTNLASGSITGGHGGITLRYGASADNAGYVGGTASQGIVLSDGSLLTNRSSGTVIAAQGVYLGGGTLINAGSIIGYDRQGVYAQSSGGTVTNVASGMIQGLLNGIKFTGTAAVVNDGTVSVTNTLNGYGIHLGSGGSVTNQADGLIDANVGVYATNTVAAIVNFGTIAGPFAAIKLAFGGHVTNFAGATLTSAGYAPAVYINDGGTLVNAGLIQATAAGGTAVGFNFNYNNLLVIDPGAAFDGTVTGGSGIGASNRLELASGSGAGTLTDLGIKYIHFGSVTIDAAATWSLSGDSTIAPGVTLTELSGAMVTDSGKLMNYGDIVLDPSTLTVGDLVGTGRVTIAAGSTLEVQGSADSTQTVMFSGAGAYLHLDTPTSAAAGVTGFDIGETIDLKGIDPASVTLSSNTLQFTGGSFPLDLAAGPGIQATASGDGADVTVLCFCVNTMIMTPRGEIPVQDLAIGDPVITASSTTRRIAWIGSGRVLATRGRRNAATPVIVRKGALSDNVPHHDLHLTKGHALYLDNALIPVEFLVNHRSIEWNDAAQEVELYHIELESHDVLLANGAPAESYRDDGNRWLFENANSGWGLPPQNPCAPVLTGGPLVDAAWRRLLDRAGPRPGLPLTEDPDLHLLFDGKRLDASFHQGRLLGFTLPARPRTLRVMSRAAAPDQLGLARDPRVLGIALRRIGLRHGTRCRMIEANDPRLTDGFHAFERGNGLRWTNGDAGVPDSLLQGCDGAMQLLLYVGCTGNYLLEQAVTLAA